jgi:iron complex transport system substrate-binding protein
VIARRALLALLAGLPAAARATPPARIVAVGGAVTETVFALGAGARVVATDSTSRFPEGVRALPQVGYLRALAPEGLISLAPDLLLLSDQAGPPQAVEVLRAARLPIAIIPDAAGIAGVVAKIGAVAAALGLDGGPLARGVAADWALLDAPIAALRPVRAIFVLSASRGAPLVSGRDTHADAMLRAAGATNAVTAFPGYRPLSAEAAATFAPEAVVMMEHALAEAGGIDQVLRIPALAVTPAAAARRVAGLDGSYVLGFGPRAAHARRHAAALLHPRAALPELPARPWT